MKKLKVISLFSGIGAQERGLQELNIDYELLNFCEFDETKAKAYSLLHAEPVEKNLWDITKVDLNTIKQSDLILYSPPCQSWSVAGKKKGINDIRGTLFWNALDIIKKSNPKYAIMENVNNLPNKFTDEEKEAQIVKDIFTLRLENKSYSTIAKILKEKYSKKIHFDFHSNRVHKIATNKFYYGVFTWA